MSDEEKKAIEWLKLVSNIATNKYTMKEQTYLYILLNLIEKQSKEIEELKANKGYNLGFIDGGIAKRYEYEDKIKAKIEYNKVFNDNIHKYTTLTLEELLKEE